MLTLPENITCGYCDCSEFGSLSVSPKRTVQKYEIEFYLKDGKTTTADDNTYEIKKNYIQIAKPGQVRHSELPFNTFYIKFNAEGEIAEKLQSIPEYFSNHNPQKIYKKINEIILLSESDNKVLFYSKVLSLINLVFSESSIPEERNEKNVDTVNIAKKYIELHLEEKISLQDIARSVHLSEIYFHNIFVESTGISPHQYLIACRIEKAKKLLWDTNIPISVVAEKSGFGCQQYLNKVFKHQTGFTPAAYRKSFQQNYLR